MCYIPGWASCIVMNSFTLVLRKSQSSKEGSYMPRATT